MALSFQPLATTSLLPVSLHLSILCGTYKWNSTTQLSNSTPRNIPKTTENSAQTGMCTQMLSLPWAFAASFLVVLQKTISSSEQKRK